MRKHIISLLLGILSIAAPSFAEVVQIDGIEYSFSPVGATANKLVVVSDYVEIPSTIIYNDETFPVTAIGLGFAAGTDIKGVTIPESVTFINSSAFARCHSLENVITKGALRISNNCFFDTPSLRKITLYPGTSLRDEAFRLSNLSEVKLFDGIYFGEHAVFSQCQITELDLNNCSMNICCTSPIGSLPNLKRIIYPREADEFGLGMAENSPELEYVETPVKCPQWNIMVNSFANYPLLTKLVLRSETYIPSDVFVSDIANAPSEAIATARKCTLYVPGALVDAYSADKGWSDYFKAIRSIEEARTRGEINGINDPVVAGDYGDATYYRLNGTPVLGEPEPGIYIRRCNGRTSKVVVR